MMPASLMGGAKRTNDGPHGGGQGAAPGSTWAWVSGTDGMVAAAFAGGPREPTGAGRWAVTSVSAESDSVLAGVGASAAAVATTDSGPLHGLEAQPRVGADRPPFPGASAKWRGSGNSRVAMGALALAFRWSAGVRGRAAGGLAGTCVWALHPGSQPTASIDLSALLWRRAVAARRVAGAGAGTVRRTDGVRAGRAVQ